MLSEASLQIAEKRTEVKGKGEKERYAHLNTKFQRIARREKKAFLSDQCKEIEKNNRMGIFPFLLCFSLPFFSQLFVRPPQTAILLLCISFSWGWSCSLCPVQYLNLPP